MKIRREQESEIAFVQQVLHVLRSHVQRKSQPFQSIRGPAGGGHRAVAVLHHLVAHARQRQGRGGGAIEGAAAVAARADYVNAVAFQPFHAVGAAQGNAHGVGHFQRGFPLHAQAHQEAARLGRRHASVHDIRKTGGGHVRRQVLPGGQRIQNAVDPLLLLTGGNDIVRKIAQKLETVRRQDGFRMELDAHPRAVVVAQRHNLPFRTAGSDGEPGIRFILLGLDHQGMVAAHGHGIGKSCEQPGAVVDNVRTLSVHHVRSAGNLRPGKITQKLVAQAYAQHGNGGGKALQELQAQPGIARMAGAGGNAHGFQFRAGCQVQNARIVVRIHHGLAAQGIKRLHQIPRKGIVIINEQKHGLLLSKSRQ